MEDIKIMLKHYENTTDYILEVLKYNEPYIKESANVQLISSDGVIFVSNKLYLVSCSTMLHAVLSDIESVYGQDKVTVIHTDLDSSELRIVVDFVMLGILPFSQQVESNCYPNQTSLDVLKCFGIETKGYHFSKYSLNEIKIAHDQFEFDRLFDVDKKLGADIRTQDNNNQSLSMGLFLESCDDGYENDSMESLGFDGMFQTEDDDDNDTNDIKTAPDKLLTKTNTTKHTLYANKSKKIKKSSSKFKLNFERKKQLQSLKQVPHANLQNRERNRTALNSKDFWKRRDNSGVKPCYTRKSFMQLKPQMKTRRIQYFFDCFIKEAERHEITPHCFAAYLGYISSIVLEPKMSNSFKRLHEGDDNIEDIAMPSSVEHEGETQAKSTSPKKKIKLSEGDNGKYPQFMQLSYAEKESVVGAFYEIFLEEAKRLDVPAPTLAAYLGKRTSYNIPSSTCSMYNANRLISSCFRKLYNGEDAWQLWNISRRRGILEDGNTYKLQDKLEHCAACGIWLKGSLADHMRNMHPKYDNKCLSCDASVMTWEEHVAHANELHRGVVRRKCNVCELIFDSAGELNSHKSRQHPPKTPLKICVECGKQVAHMNIHMNTDHGKEPVTCAKCCKVFNHPDALERHRKTTHEECQCEECGKVCNSNLSLRRHIRSMHTPDHLKPWTCSRCPKGFATKARLDDHINMHLGIKPHVCDKCGQTFSNDSNKRAHIKSVHMGMKRTK